MLHEAVLQVLKVAPSDPGPGYCRPYLQLFDPGWQGPPVAGRYGKLGIGEDPLGVLDRCVTTTHDNEKTTKPNEYCGNCRSKSL